VILNLSNQTLQYLAWIFAMISGAMALYILALNWKHPTHRLVSLFLLIIAVLQTAEGLLYGAQDISQAFLPSILIAITSLMIMPMMGLVTLRLLKPDWLKERWKWAEIAQWIGVVLVILPVFMVLVDVFSGANLDKGSKFYYSGFEPANYPGGFINLAQYTTGFLSPFLKILNFLIPFIIILLFCLYVAIFDKKTSRAIKLLAWILFLLVGFSGAAQILFQFLAPEQLGSIWFVSFLSLVVGYAHFNQMAVEHRPQRGNLQIRLTVLILAITTPLLLVVALLIYSRLNSILEQRAEETLEAVNLLAATNANSWLESQLRLLQQAALLPEVERKDEASLLPALKALKASNGVADLVSVVELNGKEIARSDGQPVGDYSASSWFNSVFRGSSTSYQVVTDPSGGGANLIIAVPIEGENGSPIGEVLSFGKISGFEEALQNISASQANQVGSTGYVFVVDGQNKVVVHPDASYTAEQADLSTYAPVAALSNGKRGLLRFTDDQGMSWIAYISQLSNGWGIIAQQTEAEALSAIRSSQRILFVFSMVGVLFLAGLIGLTVRLSLYPVRKLIETASAVSEGDLSIQAPIESEDELGYLAENFNRMTWQLKESISSLEDRVTERTADLERRSNQLKAAALVSKEAAAIRDIHQMLNQAVQLISNYFGFYHAAIFILDDVREYAILEAANSEGGQRMLARGHKLRIGQVGIVGYVADVGVPRIALDVGEDAIFFNNPDLPLTRSEMALPLKARGQVIGVLDVQSIEEAAFTNEDVETLQVLADQVALALDNARLIKETRDALDELRNIYGQRTRQAWKERLERGVLTYQYSRTGLISGSDLSLLENQPEIEGLGNVDEPVVRSDQRHEMLVPIILRGQVLGSLVLRREKEQKPWSQGDLQTAMDLIAQVLPALENARLLEEIQNRAQMETLVGQVSGKIQSSLDLETVLKTAVQEIGLVVNASRVQIRMAKAEKELKQMDERSRSE
jgi:GAF domain-containing protein/HAMP domain-containing protein